MTTHNFNLQSVHPSWLPCLQHALQQMDPAYLATLKTSADWLPGPDKIFNAFSLPLEQVNYVLFGESPYPRAASANGYAFWDARVQELWSPTGLSTTVNRATSLRNLIKMLLVAEGLLQPTVTTQEAIAHIDKTPLIKTNHAFFTRFLQQGFLLLNATPVLNAHSVQKDAKYWAPFIQSVITFLLEKKPGVEFILLGNIAYKIDKLIASPRAKKLYAEHPYNHSVITNSTLINFFQPMHLLRL